MKSKRSGHRIGLAIGILPLLWGCATTRRFSAPRADYAAYREVRTAAHPEQKLHAADAYLRRYPDGAFHDEVQAWFSQAEPEFFRQAWDRPSLLRAYQRALPRGPHEKQVSDRLIEFNLWNEYRARQESKAESFLSRVERDLQVAEESRRDFLQRITKLVGLFSDSRAYGLPTTEQNHELIYEFRLRPPAGHCEPRACRKLFELTFAVPHEKRLQARSARLELRFELQNERVVAFTLAGPELFSRLAEASDRTYIAETDLLARTEGIARAVQVLSNALEPRLPAAECERAVVAPVVMERACRGVLLRARVGEGTDMVEGRAASDAELHPTLAPPSKPAPPRKRP
ncbi:MAG TPA: hypothetical protein VFQ61_25780 [Polyangiaceae bacterium]|nr:hypothetical protein [Polyangiaceae bacterium]